jgi:hypothetical protein
LVGSVSVATESLDKVFTIESSKNLHKEQSRASSESSVFERESQREREESSVFERENQREREESS